MSERIDHAQMSKLLLGADWRDHTAVAQLAEAQVRATLALVEQQRIANLIALSQATNADGSRIMQGALTHVIDEYSVGVNAAVREGLGL